MVLISVGYVLFNSTERSPKSHTGEIGWLKMRQEEKLPHQSFFPKKSSKFRSNFPFFCPSLFRPPSIFPLLRSLKPTSAWSYFTLLRTRMVLFGSWNCVSYVARLQWERACTGTKPNHNLIAGAARHKGSILASHPAAPGSILGILKNFSMFLWILKPI